LPFLLTTYREGQPTCTCTAVRPLLVHRVTRITCNALSSILPCNPPSREGRSRGQPIEPRKSRGGYAPPAPRLASESDTSGAGRLKSRCVPPSVPGFPPTFHPAYKATDGGKIYDPRNSLRTVETARAGFAAPPLTAFDGCRITS